MLKKKTGLLGLIDTVKTQGLVTALFSVVEPFISLISESIKAFAITFTPPTAGLPRVSGTIIMAASPHLGASTGYGIARLVFQQIVTMSPPKLISCRDQIVGGIIDISRYRNMIVNSG